MTKTESGPPAPEYDYLIVFATDDPEKAANQLLSVMQTLGDKTAHIVAVGIGEYGDHVEMVAARVTAPQGSAIMGLDFEGTELEALDYVVRGAKLPPRVVMISAAAVLPIGWLQGLEQGMFPTSILLGTDKQMPALGYGAIGIVGPVTDQSANPSQRVPLTEEEAAMGLEEYAAARASHFKDVVGAADEVDGLAVMMKAELVAKLVADDGHVLDTKLGDWAMSDLCLRADRAGFRTAVVEGCFISSMAPVAQGHRKPGSIRERIDFYDKHDTDDDPTICAVYRCGIKTWHDLQLLRMSLRRASKLCPRFAILLLNNPLDMQGDPEFAQAREQELLDEDMVALLKVCDGGTAKAIARQFGKWVRSKVGHKGNNTVKVQVWDKDRDVSAERGKLMEMAQSVGGTWALALEKDELVEDRVNRDHLLRLCSHPDPRVRAWDLSFVHHWDTGRLCRVDAPFGDDNTWTGGPTHATRLWRLDGRGWLKDQPSWAPYFAPESTRIASIRLRRYGLMRPQDRDRRGLGAESQDSMRMQAWHPRNGIGLHMLTYGKELPEDIARWLDVLHGVIDTSALVWTDEWAEHDKLWTMKPGSLDRSIDPGGYEDGEDGWFPTGPSHALAAVAWKHGCRWVHQPLDNHIAEARNAGIDSLLAAKGTEDHKGLGWALFFDPDEWLHEHLADARALRRMAESDRSGWLVQTANYRAENETPTISDSVRMTKLVPEMRMDGRVHEGFNNARSAMVARNQHPRWAYAPFVLQHRGMSFGEDRMGEKLDHYEGLLRLELAERPHNPGAWVSLAWHYMNDGHTELGLECLDRAIACAGTSYLPFKEKAFHHLREARELIDQCMARLEPAHQFHRLGSEVQRFMGKYAPPHPVIARREDREPMALPEWTPPAPKTEPGYDQPE